MNITEFVKQMGTTRTTIYKKINAAGIDVDTLRDENGELTDKGLSTLSALLDGTQTPRKPQTDVDTAETGANLKLRLTALQTELDEIRVKLEHEQEHSAALQQTINDLHQQAAERERKHADELREILQRQQAIAERQLLTDRTGADGRGLFGRIHDFFVGTKKPDNPIKEDQA